MVLSRLSLRDFRNYESLDLSFPAWGAFFRGTNGSGKTNILEAIHLLSSYKSFRGASPRVLLRHDRGEGLVSGHFTDESGLANTISLSFGHKKKACS